MTRRTLLTFLPGALLAAETKPALKPGRPLQARGEFVRFADAATENVVVRLTHPNYQSLVPEPGNRFISSREGFLIFASDRDGKFAPFHANLHTGAIIPLAETDALEPRSVALSFREHELYFVDGKALRAVDLRRAKHHTVCDAIDEFHIGGRNDALVIRQKDKLIRWAADGPAQLAEDVSSRGVVNPSGTGCMFARQTKEQRREFWFVSFDEPKPRLLASGDISSPCWRPDGETLLFLRQIQKPNYIASVLFEVAPDGSPEHQVEETSQFACFAPNGNGSVFVGASRSKAQPDVILLLRSVKREMVLCEHRSSTPRLVSPAFSPNSQRVYFQSDHQGKSSLYSVNVERLVEETEEL